MATPTTITSSSGPMITTATPTTPTVSQPPLQPQAAPFIPPAQQQAKPQALSSQLSRSSSNSSIISTGPLSQESPSTVLQVTSSGPSQATAVPLPLPPPPPPPSLSQPPPQAVTSQAVPAPPPSQGDWLIAFAVCRFFSHSGVQLFIDEVVIY